MTVWYFSFFLFIWWIVLIDLPILNRPCCPGMNPTWWTFSSFFCLLLSLCVDGFLWWSHLLYFSFLPLGLLCILFCGYPESCVWLTIAKIVFLKLVLTYQHFVVLHGFLPCLPLSYLFAVLYWNAFAAVFLPQQFSALVDGIWDWTWDFQSLRHVGLFG